MFVFFFFQNVELLGLIPTKNNLRMAKSIFSLVQLWIEQLVPRLLSTLLALHSALVLTSIMPLKTSWSLWSPRSPSETGHHCYLRSHLHMTLQPDYLLLPSLCSSTVWYAWFHLFSPIRQYFRTSPVKIFPPSVTLHVTSC